MSNSNHTNNNISGISSTTTTTLSQNNETHSIKSHNNNIHHTKINSRNTEIPANDLKELNARISSSLQTLKNQPEITSPKNGLSSISLTHTNGSINFQENGVLKFPVYYGTDEIEFSFNREVSRKNRKAKRDLYIQNYNKKHVSPASPVMADDEQYSIDGELESNITKPLNLPPVPKPLSNWSTMLQQSISKDEKVKPAHQNNIGKPPAIKKPLSSSSAQPLGVLLLRLMYDMDYSPLRHDDKKTLPILPHGLVNTGNICYMNSVLQLLLYCEPFYKMLNIINSKAIGSLATVKSSTPLLDATIHFTNEFKPNNLKLQQDEEISKQIASMNAEANLLSKEFGAPLTPEHFYMSLIKHEKFSHLKWGQQEDAEEFLGYFLDGLHEEFIETIQALKDSDITHLLNSVDSNKELIKSAITRIKRIKSDSKEINEEVESESDEDGSNEGWKEVGTNKKIAAKRTFEVKPSPINTLFGGQFRSVLHIPRNKESQSITLDPFQHIQLDISDPRVNTLEEAFKLLSEPEQIPYKSSQNREVIAKKQTFLDKLPNVLIIHLKRFSYTNSSASSPDLSSEAFGSFNSNYGRIEKLRKKITYGHNLSIPLECISTITRKHIQLNNFENEFSNNYKLIGVVYHHGISAEGGHYTVDALRFDTKYWIRIDDTQIVKLEQDDVTNSGAEDDIKSAYILMYEKI